MTKVNLQPIKGTRDFYPDEMRFRKWLFAKMRKTAERFGFEEYDGPILEPIELYLDKSSEELVKKQTFLLKDRGNRTLALRPELTPTLARMVASKQNQLIFPTRWYSIGERFRYEQPQKGRYREFYQWDVDLLGSTSSEADAEIINLAVSFFKELGFTSREIVIKINSRKLMDLRFQILNISSGQKRALMKAIDRRDKVDNNEWLQDLVKIGLTKLQITNLQKILSNRDWRKESSELTRVFTTLSDLGVSDFVEYDPAVVRGLDYYTDTVFEARDKKGKFRAILGGGRYADLITNLGGKKISGVGFAAGDAILELLLKDYQKMPVFPSTSNVSVLVSVFAKEQLRTSLKTATRLRNAGINTEFYLQIERLDKQLKYADKRGIPYVIIIGPNEEKNGTITVKDLNSQTQETTTIETFIKKQQS